MFSNDVMLDSKIWNDVLRAMIAVRNAHGWDQARTSERGA
jgi:hypothetical protein